MVLKRDNHHNEDVEEIASGVKYQEITKNRSAHHRRCVVHEPRKDPGRDAADARVIPELLVPAEALERRAGHPGHRHGDAPLHERVAEDLLRRRLRRLILRAGVP